MYADLTEYRMERTKQMSETFVRPVQLVRWLTSVSVGWLWR